MTGEIGTSKTARQYRYYKCNRAKKKQCDKKTVRKEWLEDLVIATIMELITEDDVIEELADRIFDLQNSETHASVAIQAQIDCTTNGNRAVDGEILAEIITSLTQRRTNRSQLRPILHHAVPVGGIGAARHAAGEVGMHPLGIERHR